ncbi:hypothetical protein BCR41DRAFT_198942 [Lobosporangium transversale]|uniref:Crinkler effector protein N-terminal domain-containing protein n=1 Tax=Lobosporangium transversale TaxID=64571 RepID=A0A1Y2G8L4_9FUNG|nr:hypothetical protein BCR41DRAFT_198942 [Lobosporangium transversale]ORZ04304.1 hypothetical protein BCR41DRAFT_198942 [Lobosporangium transversale]|eukprot:XP_021876462.1 hypothetical protein BCR41DRAFT_198942 [Lobosporangium transversale]
MPSPPTESYEKKEGANEVSSSTNEPKSPEPAELKIFCIVDGEATSFPVKILSNSSVGELKQAIYPNITVDPSVKPKDLTLYKVSIPDEGKTVVESEIESKEALTVASRELGDIFNSELPKETIHVLVKPPQKAFSFIVILALPLLHQGR